MGPPKILSRARELEAIARFLRTIPDGPVALVLAGAAGIGKTAMWCAAVASAEERGYRVLSSPPTEAEATGAVGFQTDAAVPTTGSMR